eukprot:5916019-Prymnesium_polylepis.1
MLAAATTVALLPHLYAVPPCRRGAVNLMAGGKHLPFDDFLTGADKFSAARPGVDPYKPRKH